jgi:plastocyanin
MPSMWWTALSRETTVPLRMTSCVRAAIVTVAALAPIFGASASAEPKTIEVVIEHFAFVPSSVEVAPGDRVVFTNHDIAPHTATAVDGSWTTEEIPRGRSETLVVPTNGSGEYVCAYHPTMSGQLVIAPAQ